jgi:hypothetical protein
VKQRDFSSRTSRAYFPNNRPSARDYVGHAFMFVRDVPLGIMPMRASRDRESFEVRFEPADPAREQWLVGLLEIGQARGPYLPQLLVDFVETLARDLAHNGEAHFEIVEPPSEREPCVTLLASLPPGEIRLTDDVFLQVVPDSDRTLGEPTEIAVAADKMWHIQLPAELGTPREHRKMIARLARDSNPMPDFALEGGDLGASAGYEFATHRRAVDISMENATRKWGSIPSLRQIKGTTEYFFIARTLQFLHSQALLREHIVGELNTLITRLGVEGVIVVAGIPTAHEISELEDKLQRGEIGFKEAVAGASI